MASSGSAAMRRRLAGGAASGAVATLAMSGMMFAAQRAGLMGSMPPEKITTVLIRRMGWRRPPEPARNAAAALLHLAFGAGAGALYGVFRLRRRLPGPPIVTGVLFAAGIWLVSYAGWVPAMGIMAPPPKDRPGRPESMIAAHVVFGAVLGALARRL